MKVELILMFSLFLFPITNSNAQCLRGDCFDGMGEYRYPSGALYKGQFKGGKIHGHGILYSKNGNVYKGQWKAHYKNGQGKFIFANGDSYQGGFVKSKFQGKGIMDFQNGDVYSGSWKGDHMDGHGKYSFHNGDVYEGNFEKGNMHGYGHMYYHTGSVYEGEWVANKKEGAGVLTAPDGKLYDGMWKNGDFVKEELSTLDMEMSSTSGTFTYRDGSSWEGELRDGKPHGLGTLFYATGNRYEGYWEHHAPHGEGTMYFPDSRSLSADWDNGVPKERRFSEQQWTSTQDVEVDHDLDVKVWAVVVGVASYNHMPKLNYTDDDAYQIFAFLKSPEGGAVPDDQIEVLVDDRATRKNILQAMEKTFLQADDNDVVLLYFSGHGLPGYFLPHDFDGLNNRLKHEEIQAVFAKSKAKHKICFADACHSGTMLASKGVSTRLTLEKFYQAFDNTEG
ncbi:MAG: peptidase C14 caspase catalytic subunit p20, partial [Saprospiraceae bacterium]|nr:peptidase C14 caspase catalytic subunit p20 [Saprospiraceae bacterium]